MKNLLKNFIILMFLIFFGLVFSLNITVSAQIGLETPKEIIEQIAPEPPKPIKKSVMIDGETLFYIGAMDEISAKQRILNIKANINNIIIEIITHKEDLIDVETYPVDDYYNISINKNNLIKVTTIDSEVNNLEKSELADVWKSNIVEFIQKARKNKTFENIQNTYESIAYAMVIFFILIGFAELFRVQISKLIIVLIEKLFRNLDFILHNIKKKTQEIETTKEIQDQIAELEELNKKKLDKRISVIKSEIKGLINIFVRIVQILLILSFSDYILYTIPATNEYVRSFTHFIISLIAVINDSLSKWLLSEGTWEAFIRILVIIVTTIIIIYLSRILGTTLENIIQTLLEEDKGRAKRVQTITTIVRTTLNILIIILALVLILSELGVNIAPIIAGAGIIGLAISFGSQSLVKDIINGIFILIENQFGIGDVVTISGISGAVEDMTLRVTILRDLSGNAHIIPNGQITTATVLTRRWSRAHLDISIAYKDDIDKAINIIKKVADDMYSEFPEKIIAEPEVLGVNCLNNSSVDIKLIIKTKPGEQWSVEREYRRRIKYAFDENNIEIPFPHTTLYIPEPVGYEKSE